MTSTVDITEIPLLDSPPSADPEPRRITFQPPPLRRRGFLRVLGVGGMALGMTVLSWVPVGRRASAVVGTEYTHCASYRYDGIICTPAVYHPSYCGSDKWFKNGCFRGPDGHTDCFRPLVACRNTDGRYRNAWRWTHNGVTYRCADGELKCQNCPWVFKICNARL